MEKQLAIQTKPLYKDLYFRIGLSLLAAHSIIAFGIDKTIWELLLMTAYYRALAASSLIAFTLISIIRYVTLKLDKNWPYGKDNTVRLIYQLLLGIILISAVAFILAAIYFWLHGLNILKTVYLKYDFPVIVIFLVMINIYYFAYYQYALNKNADNRTAKSMDKYKSQFLVTDGNEKIPIKFIDVASFYREGNYNWLRTLVGKTFLYDFPLDDTEQQIDPEEFYRANRQIITSRYAFKLKASSLLPLALPKF